MTIKIFFLMSHLWVTERQEDKRASMSYKIENEAGELNFRTITKTVEALFLSCTTRGEHRLNRGKKGGDKWHNHGAPVFWLSGTRRDVTFNKFLIKARDQKNFKFLEQSGFACGYLKKFWSDGFVHTRVHTLINTLHPLPLLRFYLLRCN